MDIKDVLLDAPSWALLLGVVAPLLTAVVNQPRWTGAVRQVVAIGVSIVLGVLGVLADGSITSAGSALAVVAVIAVASHLSYKTITGKLAAAVETATSRKTYNSVG